MKNILFDLDDTLLDFRLAEKTALTKTLLHLGIEPKEAILARYSELNVAQWKLLEKGKLTLEEVKVRRYEQLFDEIGADCCAEYATGCYENFLKVGHNFVDGAEQVLEALSKDYRLYIASNGSENVQRSRIESADIVKYLDGVFISQQSGFNKPHEGFFNYCFSKIPDFKKAETLIIGDSLSSDIKGGKNVGITTVWFNPHNINNSSDIVSDYEIRNLLDLIPLLENI